VGHGVGVLVGTGQGVIVGVGLGVGVPLQCVTNINNNTSAVTNQMASISMMRFLPPIQ